MMTVGELIDILKLHAPDTRVVVAGYEDGYDDLTLVREISIKPVDKEAWFAGRYESAEATEFGPSKKALLLFGKDRGQE